MPAYKIYENDFVYAFLTRDAIRLGHTLIVPKVEIDYFLEVPEPFYTEVFKAAKTICIEAGDDFMATSRNIGAYFEIPVKDLNRAIAFYSKLFSVEFVRASIHGNEMAFFPSANGVQGISGALAQGEIYHPSVAGTLIYLSTEDVDKTLALVTEMGCAIMFEKTSVENYGYVAEFRDCEGNRIALFQSV